MAHYPGYPGRTVHEEAAIRYITLNQPIELLKERGNLFLLPIEKRVRDVQHRVVEVEMLHVAGRSYHCIGRDLPVLMFYERRKVWSVAELMLPM